MMKKPILSIIIPVYNVQDYLEDCLKSIISSDLSQVEVLVINDGSTDSSLKIIKKYSERYSNIICYDKENSGVSATRNFGLKKSRGKWIWFIDSDDLIKTNILAGLVQFLINTDLDVFLFQLTMFQKKVTNRYQNDTLEKEKISRYDAMKTLINPKYASFSCNKIFKKSLFSNTSFLPTRDFTEDMAIVYKLYNKANIFFMTSSSLYFYRQRKGSLIHTISVKNLGASAHSHYEMEDFFEHEYPDLAHKFHQETIASIVSYFHRLNLRDIKKEQKLYSYINRYKDYAALNNRYKIEIFSLKYCYPIFKFIGYVGVLSRKFKQNEK